MNNAAKNFNIQLVFMIILIIQQNYFSDLYPAKILDLSAKSFLSVCVTINVYIIALNFTHVRKHPDG